MDLEAAILMDDAAQARLATATAQLATATAEAKATGDERAKLQRMLAAVPTPVTVFKVKRPVIAPVVVPVVAPVVTPVKARAKMSCSVCKTNKVAKELCNHTKASPKCPYNNKTATKAAAALTPAGGAGGAGSDKVDAGSDEVDANNICGYCEAADTEEERHAFCDELDKWLCAEHKVMGCGACESCRNKEEGEEEVVAAGGAGGE